MPIRAPLLLNATHLAHAQAHEGVAAIVLGMIFLIAAAVGIVMYVLKSMGLYTIAKRRGLKLYGMAWVPVGSIWLMGSIADQYVRKANGRDKRLRVLLLIGVIVVWILEIVSLVLTVSAVVEIVNSGGGLAELQGMSPVIDNMMISWAISAVSTVFYVFYYIALFKAYRSCAAGNAAWMLVLSILFSTVAESIILFCIRKKDVGFYELQRKAAEYYTES